MENRTDTHTRPCIKLNGKQLEIYIVNTNHDASNEASSIPRCSIDLKRSVSGNGTLAKQRIHCYK